VARKRDRAARRPTHGCATTTPSMRRAIQASEEKNTVLAARLGVHRKTIAKWKRRDFTSDQRMGPKNPGSKLLSRDDEAIILAYRWRTRLTLDDCLVRLKRLKPHLSRSALYRCLKRWGVNRIGPTAASPHLTNAALAGPFYFDITANEVLLHSDGIDDVFVPVFLAVEEITKDVFAEAEFATPLNASMFLGQLVAQSPQKIIAVTTDTLPPFADRIGAFGEDVAAVGQHPFALTCRDHGIVHKRRPLAPKSSEANNREPLRRKGRSSAVEIR
jgi:transposase